MTIVKDTNSPLVVVVGGTGTQGGSVVLALSESDKSYRIRTFTRNTAKPSAIVLSERGVQVVGLSLTANNKEAVFAAFEGAAYVFVLTATFSSGKHFDPGRETAEGELMIDAAKAAGVKGIVWSGLPSMASLSHGKYTQVCHFESKVRVSEYGRASGVPFVVLQAGGYASNMRTIMRPRKVAPDVWAVSLPIAPSAPIPLIDVHHDYGLFVRRAIEATVFPDRQTWAVFAEMLSSEDQVRQLSEATGKKVVFNQITSAAFVAGMTAAGMPVHLAVAFDELFAAIGEFGYYTEDAVQLGNCLGRRVRTWRDYVQVQVWDDVFDA
ncbi:hypothetical protein MIND_00176800 [Mycena indigotica]|uniref:NmrA-like domain-containing protein n=1 Tax=Mycena indigotica TaxID=2126181 RepID=A0A8H6TH11_9AGAR|nr:uncharacterized protein MIND_00176800 [Mycena indigotica]KAF7316572.1 hypothetical protein MIND_00176800 [Mycena indigotica]